MSPPPTVDAVRAAFLAELDQAAAPDRLQELRHRYLGRKRGAVTALLKSVAAAPPAARRDLGRRANALKQEIERALAARRGSAAKSAAQAVTAAPGQATTAEVRGPTRRPAAPGAGSRAAVPPPLRPAASTSRCPAGRFRSGTAIR